VRHWPLAVLALWAFMALVGPWLPLAPDTVHLEHILEGPGEHAWLGYDDLGRPVWDRLVYGARTSFLVGVWVVALSLVLGTVIGALSGYLGGRVDAVVVRLIDVFLAVPGILLAIALAGLLGPGIGNVVLALSAVGWVGYARLARAQVLSLKHRDHVLAAQALGAGTARIVGRHLLPLIAAPLIPPLGDRPRSGHRRRGAGGEPGGGSLARPPGRAPAVKVLEETRCSDP